jgi:type I restriction enzyme, S subunit
MKVLPSSWALARIGDLVQLGPKNDVADDTGAGFVPLQQLGVTYRSRHTFEVRPWGAIKNGYTHFADGDVLLARITPSFENGKAGIARGLPNGIGAGSTEYFVFRTAPDALLPEYLLAYFKTADFLRAGEQVMSGAVGQQRVPKHYVLNCELPLPPFNEQRRIVRKVESIFARLDRCRELLDDVAGIADAVRRAMLEAAIAGSLTEDWRSTRRDDDVVSGSQLLSQIAATRAREGLASARRSSGDEGIPMPDRPLPLTWAWCRVGDIADVRLGGTPARSNPIYWHGSIPWVSSGEVANCRIRHTAEKITASGVENSNAKVYPIGTVLIAMIGEGKTRGQSALLEIEAATNQNVAGLVFDVPLVDPLYVWTWALQQYEITRAVGRGGAQPALNGAKVRALPLPLPPLDEQREIAQRVEALLQYLDQMEHLCATSRRRTDDLEQTVLNKALSGGLVPQDPNDEPADVMLDRSRVARVPTDEARPRQRAPRAPKEHAVMTKSRFDEDVKGQRYLATLLRSSTDGMTAEELFRLADLPLVDFYKQLAWEVENGSIRDDSRKLQAL